MLESAVLGRAVLRLRLHLEGRNSSADAAGSVGEDGGFSGAGSDLRRSNEGLCCGSSQVVRMIADISDNVVIMEMYESRKRRVVGPLILGESEVVEIDMIVARESRWRQRSSMLLAMAKLASSTVRFNAEPPPRLVIWKSAEGGLSPKSWRNGSNGVIVNQKVFCRT